MSENELLYKGLDRSRLPVHVAIIMDGNGRWAKSKGLGRIFGHKNSVKAVEAAIETCADLGIKHLTLYAFSTENWNRPIAEVSSLMSLLLDNIKEKSAKLNEEGIKFQVLGDMDRFSDDIVTELEKLIKLTENNTNGVLNVALNYGSKSEIINAVKILANKVKNQELDPDDINESEFEKHLYTKSSPNVDLMIRTSGEYRISNFLLWQIAYAELYFCEVLWPDFRKENFAQALMNYQSRNRRFGLAQEQIDTI